MIFHIFAGWMKNMLTSIAAMLLVIWYSLSVIGFDVHTCSTSGETYIATLASGFSCDDLHPESHQTPTHHGHTGCKCCHSHKEDASSLTTKPCCSNDFQVILLTGVRGMQDSDGSDECKVTMRTVAPVGACDSCSNVHRSGLRAFYKPSSGNIVPRDVQAVYNIWRI